MSVETGTITLENSLFGEKTFESTEVIIDEGGGGGGSVFKCTITDSDSVQVLDKTYAEIEEAYKAGKMVIAAYVGSQEDGGIVLHYEDVSVLVYLQEVTGEQVGYSVAFRGQSMPEFFSATKDGVLSSQS